MRFAAGAVAVVLWVSAGAEPVTASVAMAAPEATNGGNALPLPGTDTPPGQLVDIGSHRLHLNCIGEGSPTVVLEAGLGGFSLEWWDVQHALAGSRRACSYDRGGYGWSDPGPAPRTAAHLTEELHALLMRAGEPAPYLLVGHSFGGYMVQLFAKEYPALTTGVVLVDASHPDQFRRFPPGHQALYRRASRRQTTWATGIPALPENYPQAVRELALKLMEQPKTQRALKLEYRSFTRSGAEVAAAGALPDVPAVVLTRSERQWPATPEGDAMEALWPELQNELAAALPRARHFVIGSSGHHIHLDQPHAIAEAVDLVIEQGACADPAIAGPHAGGRPGAC